MIPGIVSQSNAMNNLQKIFLLSIIAVLVSGVCLSQARFGKPAPQLSLPSLQGDSISLSSLKGKVVLIDFWASWCGPCRISNKQLVKLYAKYKDKGFEIYGISIDENRNAWEKAVKKDKITWLQVNDDAGSASPVTRDWNVYQIPTSYLMDQNGNLIAMDLDTRSLERKLKELLH